MSGVWPKEKKKEKLLSSDKCQTLVGPCLPIFQTIKKKKRVLGLKVISEGTERHWLVKCVLRLQVLGAFTPVSPLPHHYCPPLPHSYYLLTCWKLLVIHEILSFFSKYRDHPWLCQSRRDDPSNKGQARASCSSLPSTPVPLLQSYPAPCHDLGLVQLQNN